MKLPIATRYFYLLFFFFFSIHFTQAQTGFKFIDQTEDKAKVRFRLVNNLIVMPITINGKELSFILDSGVNKTILFSLMETDTLGLQDVKRISLQGLGQGQPVEALLSKNNTFQIDKISSNEEALFVILEDQFELSYKMGVTIHGIIGYTLLKNFIVNIDYKRRYIEFYNPELFQEKRCRKCQTFPLVFHNDKPYINAAVTTGETSNEEISVKLLIDSGGSDSLWLFEGAQENITPPKKYFDDILGEGLSGAIYGKRSRIENFRLGTFEIPKPTVSYLDTVSTVNARAVEDRDGSLGGNILKRFQVWFDYANAKVTFKKTGSFTTGFDYNMSGLTVVYDGERLVKKPIKAEISIYNTQNNIESPNNIKSFVTSYNYLFRPLFKVDKVVKGSPADLAGIQSGDFIMSINNKEAFDYRLEQIVSLFQERDNKRILMTVKRNGKTLNFKFRLKREI